MTTTTRHCEHECVCPSITSVDRARNDPCDAKGTRAHCPHDTRTQPATVAQAPPASTEPMQCTRHCPAMRQPPTLKESPDGCGTDYWFCNATRECVRPKESTTPEIFISPCFVWNFFEPRARGPVAQRAPAITLPKDMTTLECIDEGLKGLSDYFNTAIEGGESKAALRRMWDQQMGIVFALLKNYQQAPFACPYVCERVCVEKCREDTALIAQEREKWEREKEREYQPPLCLGKLDCPDVKRSACGYCDDCVYTKEHDAAIAAQARGLYHDFNHIPTAPLPLRDVRPPKISPQ